MQPSGYTTPANYIKPPQALLVGVDSLWLNFDGEPKPGLLDWLIKEGGELNWQGFPLTLNTQSRGVYKAALDSPLISISLDNKLPSFSSPPIRVQMRPELLWSMGLIAAHNQVRGLAAWLLGGNIEDEKVSRLDLCADFEWPQGFVSTDIDKFRTRARKMRTYHKAGNRAKEVTGFTIGVSALIGKIYDKAYDVRGTGNKWFYDLWGRGRDAKVWRTEFQLQRNALRRLGVERFDDVVNRSQSVWDYCVGKWLTMCEPEGRNVSRWPLTPFWEMVQQAHFNFGENPRPFEFSIHARQRQTRQQLFKQVAGLVGSHARRNEGRDPSEFFEDCLPDIRKELRRRALRTKRN